MIITSKTKIPLGGGWALWIVNAGRSSDVILNFTEEGGPVRDRISVRLGPSQALQAARALGGIRRDGPPFVDDEDDTEPG